MRLVFIEDRYAAKSKVWVTIGLHEMLHARRFIENCKTVIANFTFNSMEQSSGDI